VVRGPQSERGTDRAFLQRDAYADSTKLRARGSIYRYRDPPGAIGPWVLAHLDLRAGDRLLDVGCGPGAYLALLPDGVRGVGADLSFGMASEAHAHAHAPTVNADVAQLPFPPATFDHVIAPHMLYHCPDLTAALVELRRVMTPPGTFLAVTNGPDHLQELWDLHEDVTGTRPPLVSDRFDLDNGTAALRAHFATVTVHHFSGTVAVPDASLVREYYASLQHFAGIDGRAVLDALEARVQRTIDEHGAFRARTHSGALVCTD